MNWRADPTQAGRFEIEAGDRLGIVESLSPPPPEAEPAPGVSEPEGAWIAALWEGKRLLFSSGDFPGTIPSGAMARGIIEAILTGAGER